MSTQVSAIAGIGPVGVVLSGESAPSGDASVGAALPIVSEVPRALRLVSGGEHTGLSLASPAGARMRMAQVSEFPPEMPLTLEERQAAIQDLVREILTDRARNVDTTEAEQEVLAYLWDTPLGERRILAQWLASTAATGPSGETMFLDQVLDETLEGDAWRSFSFFMYQYTAGFGDREVPPVIVGGVYHAPDWWYTTRPYDRYEPYWQYRLPSSCPFIDLPVVIITIPHRGHYRGPHRGRDWHYPRNHGDRWQRPPRRPGPRPEGPRRPGGHRRPGPGRPGGPRRPEGPRTPPQGPRLPPQGPRLPPQGPRVPPEGPRMPPEGPRRPEGPRLPPQGPRVPPEGPRQPPQGPRGPNRPEGPRGPNRPEAPRGPRGGEHRPEPPRQQPRPTPNIPRPTPNIPRPAPGHGGGERGGRGGRR
ncbi:MAG: hypothetical protein ACAI38_15445 [Myxococcota bacterium]